MAKPFVPNPLGEHEKNGLVGSKHEAFMTRPDVSTDLSRKEHAQQKNRRLRRRRKFRNKHGRP